MLARKSKQGNPFTLLVGILFGAITMENRMVYSENVVI